MEIVIFMQHPVEANMYQYVVPLLEKKGHNINIIIMEKENMISEIVKNYTNNYFKIGQTQPEIIKKAFNIIKIDKRLLKKIKEIKPSLILSPSTLYAGHVASVLNIPHIGFCDTETAKFNQLMSFPFQDVILTPSSYYEKVPIKKHVVFNGSKELAYLHPNWYKPDSSVLDNFGLSKSDKIVLMRFSAKIATHDIGSSSIVKKNLNILYKKIKEIEEFATILISSTEISLGKKFEKFHYSIPPHKYIDLLSFCGLYLGEGSTSAAEAGVLGVPWIFTQDVKLGNLLDQEKNYGLGFQIPNINKALIKAKELISNKNTKSEWQKKRAKLLEDKIDVTKFLAWFIDSYPKSFKIMKKNQNFQNRFR